MDWLHDCKLEFNSCQNCTTIYHGECDMDSCQREGRRRGGNCGNVAGNNGPSMAFLSMLIERSNSIQSTNPSLTSDLTSVKDGSGIKVPWLIAAWCTMFHVPPIVASSRLIRTPIRSQYWIPIIFQNKVLIRWDNVLPLLMNAFPSRVTKLVGSSWR